MADKVGHLVAGLIIALAVGLAFGAGWGWGAAVAAGVGKEACDARGHGRVEALDLAMTCLGGVVGAVAVAIVKR